MLYKDEIYIENNKINCLLSENYKVTCNHDINPVNGPKQISLYFTTNKLFPQGWVFFIITTEFNS